MGYNYKNAFYKDLGVLYVIENLLGKNIYNIYKKL